VLLYEDYPDSGIYKIKPSYFGKTREDGTFLINNIKNSTYTVYSIEDKNSNLKYDEGEAVGFMEEKINVADTNQEGSIFLFQSEKAQPKQMFKAYSDGYGRFHFIFNFEACNINIRRKGMEFKQDWEYIGFTRSCDTVHYYTEPYNTDTITFYLSDGDFSDTARIRVKPSDRPQKVKINNPVSKAGWQLNDSIIIETSSPLSQVNSSGILLKEDSIYKTGLTWRQNREKTRMAIYYPLRENKRYVLEIRDSAFQDILGNYNDTFNVRFNTPGLKEYGTIKVSIRGTAGEQYIVQLVTEEDFIARKDIISGNADIFYQHVIPADYRIRIITDSNKNGRWDSGNILQRKQAEKVMYHPATLTVKPNWDLEDLKVEINTAN
jgi:hypothetical protein